jgi:ribosomal protein S27E
MFLLVSAHFISHMLLSTTVFSHAQSVVHCANCHKVFIVPRCLISHTTLNLEFLCFVFECARGSIRTVFFAFLFCFVIFQMLLVLELYYSMHYVNRASYLASCLYNLNSAFNHSNSWLRCRFCALPLVERLVCPRVALSERSKTRTVSSK